MDSTTASEAHRTRRATNTPRRALRTIAAAQYLGISASLLRKMRARAPGDPGDHGPESIKLSPSIVLYEISALDRWIEVRRAASRSRAA